MNDISLERFIKAQSNTYVAALNEIKSGRKRSHWMWFIFPQIKGLGYSATAQFYAISCLNEAKAYLEDEILGVRLREICSELLKHSDKSAVSILGEIDALKLRSSMTLFDLIAPNDVFAKVLEAFFNEERCPKTMERV